MTKMSRVVCWTDRNGVESVSEDMPHEDAVALAATLREANAPVLKIRVEDATTGAQDQLDSLLSGLGL